jgi:5-methylcytosine-specific restriction protein A
MPGGTVHPSTLPRGEAGRALCRWCALEVPKGRFTFCSEWCVHEWRMRTSPAYLRQQVRKRDKGICAQCQVNTLSAFLRMKKARGRTREEMLAHWGLKTFTRRSLWDADHILPVAEGGGECDLTNLRTLCLRCHREATTHLRARLLQQRRQKLLEKTATNGVSFLGQSMPETEEKAGKRPRVR